MVFIFFEWKDLILTSLFPNLMATLTICSSIPRLFILSLACLVKLNSLIVSVLLKIILFAAIFELMFKHNNPKKVVISEYLLASEFFLEKVQIGYLNAILDKISKVLRKDD